VECKLKEESQEGSQPELQCVLAVIQSALARLESAVLYEIELPSMLPNRPNDDGYWPSYPRNENRTQKKDPVSSTHVHAF
jgi:hypothetical protein